MEIKEGQTFYKKRDNRKCHIVKIFKDKNEKIVVTKYFGIHKRWWHYEVEYFFSFEKNFNYGLYSKKRCV